MASATGPVLRLFVMTELVLIAPGVTRAQGFYDLKKLLAASFEARFLVAAACNRSISEVMSAIRSVSSSTDSNETSCPISWVTFFLGLSSSSLAIGSIPSSRGGEPVAARNAAG